MKKTYIAPHSTAFGLQTQCLLTVSKPKSDENTDIPLSSEKEDIWGDNAFQHSWDDIEG